MFGINPFAAISASATPAVMQAYVVLMAVLVAAGTLIDVLHKGSARYFFAHWRKSGGGRELGAGEMASIAAHTAMVDVLASGEFCNARRRIAHLLTMYGFVLYIVSTVVLVFAYPTAAKPRPDLWPHLWWIGGLMVLAGGYWFWFFIRVDVVAEGNSPLRATRADIFVLSLVGSVTFALLWAWLQSWVLFGLYILASTVLFGSVPWSKFAHMFFKPAAAFERRVSEANGTRNNLPAPADKPEQLGRVAKHARHY
jgi:hypothetical protein